MLRAEARPREALAAAAAGLGARKVLGPYDEVTLAFIEAAEAAFDLDDLGRVTALLGEWKEVRPLERPSSLEAQQIRFAARLAARRGDVAAVEPAFSQATSIFRELSMPFYAAVTMLEHAEWLAAQGSLPPADSLLAEAERIFQKLEAQPWLDRTALRPRWQQRGTTTPSQSCRSPDAQVSRASRSSTVSRRRISRAFPSETSTAAGLGTLL